MKTISGKKSGPTTVILGSVHGNEPIGSVVIQKLEKQLDPNKISGKIILTIGNPLALEAKKRFLKKDLNRLFGRPIKNPKCYEEKRALELQKILKSCDFLLDIHSTQKPSIPFVYCKNSSKHLQLAKSLQTKFIVSTDESLNNDPELNSSTDNFVDSHGGIGLTYETGFCKDLSKKSQVLKQVLNFLKDAGNLTGKSQKTQTYMHLLVHKIVTSQKQNKDYKNFDQEDGNYIIFPKPKPKTGAISHYLAKPIMTKIWQSSSTKLHPQVTSYIISKNLAADNKLLPYDVQASTAHAKMLFKIGILSQKELTQIEKAFKQILKLYKQNQFQLEQFNEDCHTALENYLIKHIGDAGKKIHTGRSRNDQVLVAMRLFTKDHLTKIIKQATRTIQSIESFAKKHQSIPMPGYTHTQKAMPYSVNKWAKSFAASLKDDLICLKSALKLNDQNPLGSAAGFGVNLNLDKAYTTKLLGFSKTQKPDLYCQNSRGKFESFTISALAQAMLTLNKIATDLIYFTSSEFDFFQVHESLLTGSSIMPQKKNLDIMEVLRAKTSTVLAHQLEAQMVCKNLISGYNKDLKITKKLMMDSLKITDDSLKIIQLTFQNLQPKSKNLEAAMTPEIYSTHRANELVKQGMPFRQAYRQIKEAGTL